MLTASKKIKLVNALKTYKKKFLVPSLVELDESGTRLMINHFLSDVLGFAPIEEIKTEYMIRGTYADYMIQTNGIRHFLVEVKALSFQLSAKHLRQTVEYGANEGIEWAMLTNGKCFQFYRILFNKPIETRQIFSFELDNDTPLKIVAEQLQFLHKECIEKKSLRMLWNRFEALDPLNVAGILYSNDVVKVIKRLIKGKYSQKCSDEEIFKCVEKIVTEKIDPETIKRFRQKKTETKSKVKTIITPEIIKAAEIKQVNGE